MPKTAVETPICDICGAEVREGSEFCYNCGGSLGKVVSDEPGPEAIAPAAAESKNNGAAAARAKERRGARRRRAANREPIEVVWEPNEGVSGLYIAAGLVFLVVAATLLFVAMWMK